MSQNSLSDYYRICGEIGQVFTEKGVIKN